MSWGYSPGGSSANPRGRVQEHARPGLLLERVGERAAPQHVELVGLHHLGHHARTAGVVGQVVVGVRLDLGRVVVREGRVVAEPGAVLLARVRRVQPLDDRLQPRQRHLLVGRSERQAAVDQDHPAHQVGSPGGQDGRHEATHRVPDDHDRPVGDRLDHGRAVGGVGRHAVGAGQGVGPAAATQVGSDQGPVELGGQERPGPPRGRDAVDRQHGRAVALPAGDVERATRDRDVEDVGHGSGLPPAPAVSTRGSVAVAVDQQGQEPDRDQADQATPSGRAGSRVSASSATRAWSPARRAREICRWSPTR